MLIPQMLPKIFCLVGILFSFVTSPGLGRETSYLHNTEGQEKDISSTMENPIDKRECVKDTAIALIGKVDYEWGGKPLVPGYDTRWGTIDAKGKKMGLDCSGFVQWTYWTAGFPEELFTLMLSTSLILDNFEEIPYEDLQIGDLGLLAEKGEVETNHVGIYAGDGMWIHCNSANDTVSMDNFPFKVFRHIPVEETELLPYPYTAAFASATPASLDMLTKDKFQRSIVECSSQDLLKYRNICEDELSVVPGKIKSIFSNTGWHMYITDDIDYYVFDAEGKNIWIGADERLIQEHVQKIFYKSLGHCYKIAGDGVVSIEWADAYWTEAPESICGPEEFFVECMTLYIESPDSLKMNYPKAAQILQDYFGCL